MVVLASSLRQMGQSLIVFDWIALSCFLMDSFLKHLSNFYAFLTGDFDWYNILYIPTLGGLSSLSSIKNLSINTNFHNFYSNLLP